MARTVAVTGAGSGIGRAIASAFAANGDRVFIGDVSAERLDEVTAEIGEAATGIRFDVTDRQAFATFLDAAEGEGGLDVMINNAGVFDAFAGIYETDEALWTRVLEINLTGCFHGCQLAAQLMRPRGRGRIINVSSIAAFRGGLDGLAYTVSKAGILGLTRRLAFDVGRHGITANAICPGVVPTNIRQTSSQILEMDEDQVGKSGVAVTMPPEMLDYMIPLERRGEPAEIAATAIFLASEGAAYINGETIAVDGGWLAT